MLVSSTGLSYRAVDGGVRLVLQGSCFLGCPNGGGILLTDHPGPKETCFLTCVMVVGGGVEIALQGTRGCLLYRELA